MSAIWGTISYQGHLDSNIDSIMQTPYRNKCKIDDYQSGYFGNAYMGCGIQHITKESVNEALPIVDKEHGFILTTDCILDNRNELLSQLSLTDDTLPDGYLVHQAYLKWGIECVKYFRGLFTLAVWDENTQTLYLANDQVASRCLYYYRGDTCITFSTLIAPIRALHPEIALNDMFCKDYLAAPSLIPAVMVRETPYQNICKLAPASILTITQNSVKEASYWSPAEPLHDCNCKTAKEYGTYFRKLLTECVLDAIRTTGKVGIALSSGFDSSSVGVIAADLLSASNQNLYAYTYTPYEKVKENTRNLIYDETEDVKAIAAMHPNIITHFLCNEGKNAIESIPTAIDILEMPTKAFVNFPNLHEIHTKASAEGCKVVLTGQLGNFTISNGEIEHITYELYRKKKFYKLYKCLTGYAINSKISRKKVLKAFLKSVRNFNDSALEPYEFLNPFLSEQLTDSYPMKERFDKGNLRIYYSSFVNQNSYRNFLQTYTLYAYLGECDTKRGLKHGIVLRDPTKDIRMMSFCYHLPYEYFAYEGTPRWLIRGNMRDVLPHSILDNWNRRGMQNNDWLARIARDWDTLKPQYIEAINSDRVAAYVNKDKLLSAIDKAEATFTSNDTNAHIYLTLIYILSHFIDDAS